MTKIKELLGRALASLKETWLMEPTRVLWFAASAIVFAAAKFGIVVNRASLLEALAFIVPLIVGGVVNRSQVVPKARLRRRRDDPGRGPKGAKGAASQF